MKIARFILRHWFVWLTIGAAISTTLGHGGSAVVWAWSAVAWSLISAFGDWRARQSEALAKDYERLAVLWRERFEALATKERP